MSKFNLCDYCKECHSYRKEGEIKKSCSEFDWDTAGTYFKLITYLRIWWYNDS